jgi:threonylcarbamoyladenosine tRNA methylthiotransferase MtaB
MAAIHIENFGCRAARADGEAIASRVRTLAVDRPLTADVVVVNTCSVTAEADRAARSYIRRAHRKNPAARIFVTGCYAQRAPEELAAIPGVAAVIGNSHKALAPEIVFALGTQEAGADCTKSPVPECEAPGAPGEFVPVESLLARSMKSPVPECEAVGAPDTTFCALEGETPTAMGAARVWADDRFAHSFLEEATLAPGEQTRPNLKIQEGCGNRCTFCVIPLTRGPSRSLASANILGRVREFVAAGGNELVLSGINLGRWGADLRSLSATSSPGSGHGFSHAKSNPRTEPALAAVQTPVTLAALVRAILEQTALPRLRLSSIEPMDWNDELIALMREFGGTRLARHAHLPLQSGSDAVLRRMHRRYRPWHYAEKVAALCDAAGPGLTIGADVMAGFPGETDREFEETLAFLRSLPFGYLHLFPFSPRPGTPGWALHRANPVAPPAVDERMAALRALAAELSRRHRRQFVGQRLPAITLRTPAASERTRALTDNFLPVELAGRREANQLVEIAVTGIDAEGDLAAICAA